MTLKNIFNVISLLYCCTVIVNSNIPPNVKLNELYQIEQQMDSSKSNSDFSNISSTQLINDLIHQYSDDIRCRFHFIALSLMRLSENLLKWYGKGEMIDQAIKKIASFSKYSHRMLTILYNTGIPNLYVMWLFHLYTSEIVEYQQRFKCLNISSTDLLLRLYEMHMKVKENIKLYIRHDVEHNIHDIHDKYDVTSSLSPLFKDFRNLSRTKDNAIYNEAMRLTDEYLEKVNWIMAKITTFSLVDTNKHIFTSDNLYIKNIGAANNCEHFINILILFDPNIMFDKAKENLKIIYERANFNPLSIYDGFKMVKLYHETFKNILKVVMLRIVSSHANIVEKIIDNHESGCFNVKDIGKKINLTHINSDMVKILKKFVNLIGCNSDAEIMLLITFLETTHLDLSNYREKFQTKIENQLKQIYSTFGNLSDMMEPINEKKLASMMESLESYSKKSQLPTKYNNSNLINHKDISNNYYRANTFVSTVENLLVGVDLKALHILFTYSYSINN